MTDKERKEKLENMVAAAISTLLKDIVRETQGEETVREIEELTMLRGRIQRCMDKPKLISFEDVERFNRLVSKLFPDRVEE